MTAPKQVEQEARRVLRKLAAPRQLLVASGTSFVVGRGPASASRIRVTAEMVREFSAQGWIAPDGPGRHVIAPAGLALLAREGADGFATQHRLAVRKTVEEGGEQRAVLVNAGESPLSRLNHRGMVNAVQFAAGEKLRRDFTLAQLTPRMGVNWDAPVVSGSRGSGADSISDIAIAARQRLNRALAAAGPDLADIAFDVCCHLAPLEACEDARGWAKRSGRVVLKLALDRLAAHYGLGVVNQKRTLRAWSQEVS
jgi:hypothetical protein